MARHGQVARGRHGTYGAGTRPIEAPEEAAHHQRRARPSPGHST
ncbi:hypothetical protein HMPREF9946_02631 [Acetobacteraceae bacterium AT-5844]|nr:hypothetical protein HMPREF9946_02631 [Acetobacteraceae bacterium AT-5844]